MLTLFIRKIKMQLHFIHLEVHYYLHWRDVIYQGVLLHLSNEIAQLWMRLPRNLKSGFQIRWHQTILQLSKTIVISCCRQVNIAMNYSTLNEFQFFPPVYFLLHIYLRFMVENDNFSDWRAQGVFWPNFY